MTKEKHKVGLVLEVGGLRAAQKQRTQQKLLAAARAMMERGDPVTVASAAAEAGVSVATAYRYYSEAETLRTDAALDSKMGPQVDFFAEFQTRAEGVKDPRERLAIAQRQMLDFVISNASAYRLFMAKALEQRLRDRDSVPSHTRGGRRRQILESALADLAGPMGAPAWVELVLALMTVTGPEPYYTLHDYGRLAEDEIRRISEQTALDVLNAHMQRAGLR